MASTQLRSVALGRLGVESVERDLTALYEMNDTISNLGAVHGIIEHERIVQRIKNAPDFNVDMIFKVHLLKLMGQFGNDFDVVEHSCATDRNKNYSDTCRELTERANRLGMNETGEAFLTGLSEDQCAYCKEFGHWKSDCPLLKGGKGKSKGKGKGKGKSKGKGKGKGKSKGKQSGQAWSGQGWANWNDTWEELAPGQGQSKTAKARRALREAKAAAAQGDSDGSEEDYGFGFSAVAVEPDGWLTRLGHLIRDLFEQVTGNRLWGHRGERIGEASHPGPPNSVKTDNSGSPEISEILLQKPRKIDRKPHCDQISTEFSAVIFSESAEGAKNGAECPEMQVRHATNLVGWYATVFVSILMYGFACDMFPSVSQFVYSWLCGDEKSSALHIMFCNLLSLMFEIITIGIEKWLDTIAYVILCSAMDYCSIKFYVQPVAIYFIVPWMLKWLHYFCSFSHEVAWAYSLSGRRTITFACDSGATRHCVGNGANLTGFKPFNGLLKVADGRVLQVTGIGNLVLKIKKGKRTVHLLLKDVWYVQG